MLEYFPDPHPDEILYSVWARYSDCVGYPSKADVFRELFGSAAIRPIVDFPCRLQCFVDRLPLGHIYDADIFINSHTLFPYYQAFLPPERRQIVLKEMIFGTGRNIHDHIGVTKKISSSVLLRFCPMCVKEDKESFGECYWHCLHQIPGVEICPSHKTFIEKSNIRLRHGDMAPLGMISAEKALKQGEIPRKVSSLSFLDTFIYIAKESDYLLKNPLLAFDLSSLHQKYRTLLAQRGFIAPRGKVRITELFHAFEEYYSQELLSLLRCEIKFIPEKLSAQWLGRILDLLNSKRTPVLHPLYHMLMNRFLGFTFETILSQEILPFTPFGTGPWPCLNPVCEYFQQKRILTYQLPEISKTREIIGRFSCQCGYTYSRIGPDTSPDDIFRKRRVLSYGPVWEAKLRELWVDSTISVPKMESILGVSGGCLELRARKLQLPVPRSAPNTASVEKSSTRRGKDRSWYREQWLAIVENSPGATAKELQVKAKGVHTWLTNHDLEWLRVNRPISAKEKTVEKQPHLTLLKNQRKIDSERDVLLAKSIKEAACKLSLEQEPPKRISRRNICREIPELRSIPTSTYAPLAAQALKEVTETRESFALRRIDWALRQYMKEQILPTRYAFITRINIRRILCHPNVQKAFDSAMEQLSAAIKKIDQ